MATDDSSGMLFDVLLCLQDEIGLCAGCSVRPFRTFFLSLMLSSLGWIHRLVFWLCVGCCPSDLDRFNWPFFHTRQQHVSAHAHATAC